MINKLLEKVFGEIEPGISLEERVIFLELDKDGLQKRVKSLEEENGLLLDKLAIYRNIERKRL